MNLDPMNAATDVETNVSNSSIPSLGRREFVAKTVAVGAFLGGANLHQMAMGATSNAEMEGKFYRAASPTYTIADSMKDSLRFTTRKCMAVYRGNLCANSTFVDPDGIPQPWHEFGDLEGIGWAANAVGAAHEMLCFARMLDDQRLRAIGISVLHHALEGDFIEKDGFLRPYREISTDKRFLNYLHQDRFDTWFCPGSSALIALQFLWASDEVEGNLKQRLRKTALSIADWVWRNTPKCKNGWYARRVTPDGTPYSLTANGKSEDKQFDHSGDATFLLWLWIELTQRGERDYHNEVRRAASVFRDIGGAFGSCNHDTYDDHENVAYSIGFRTLIRAASLLRDDDLVNWALEHCLGGLESFEMKDDRNGVATQGLLMMEESWDTAYLWENAEAAYAYFEAAHLCRNLDYELKGLTILRTAALHHHGDHGFLTEGVDWNNHNGQWRKVGDKKIPIHVGGAQYGDVNYTQPFLNNMHITGPTLYYLKKLAHRQILESDLVFSDCEGNILMS